MAMFELSSTVPSAKSVGGEDAARRPSSLTYGVLSRGLTSQSRPSRNLADTSEGFSRLWQPLAAATAGSQRAMHKRGTSAPITNVSTIEKTSERNT